MRSMDSQTTLADSQSSQAPGGPYIYMYIYAYIYVYIYVVILCVINIRICFLMFSVHYDKYLFILNMVCFETGG